jgi:hypothetical protein
VGSVVGVGVAGPDVVGGDVVGGAGESGCVDVGVRLREIVGDGTVVMRCAVVVATGVVTTPT